MTFDAGAWSGARIVCGHRLEDLHSSGYTAPMWFKGVVFHCPDVTRR
jgi:hypothetical protein